MSLSLSLSLLPPLQLHPIPPQSEDDSECRKLLQVRAVSHFSAEFESRLARSHVMLHICLVVAQRSASSTNCSSTIAFLSPTGLSDLRRIWEGRTTRSVSKGPLIKDLSVPLKVFFLRTRVLRTPKSRLPPLFWISSVTLPSPADLPEPIERRRWRCAQNAIRSLLDPLSTRVLSDPLRLDAWLENYENQECRDFNGTPEQEGLCSSCFKTEFPDRVKAKVELLLSPSVMAATEIGYAAIRRTKKAFAKSR
eukprot:791228-Rhodomonas_salina.1